MAGFARASLWLVALSLLLALAPSGRAATIYVLEESTHTVTVHTPTVSADVGYSLHRPAAIPDPCWAFHANTYCGAGEYLAFSISLDGPPGAQLLWFSVTAQPAVYNTREFLPGVIPQGRGDGGTQVLRYTFGPNPGPGQLFAGDTSALLLSEWSPGA